MTASPPKTKLQLANGIPVTIALQYPTGKVVGSLIPGAPNQVYYSLIDGRSMYLPVEVGKQIDALKLTAGEPFTLCKRGPRDWQVERPQVPCVGPVAQPVERWAENPEITGSTPCQVQRMGPVNGQGEDAGAILGRCYARAIGIALEAVEIARGKGLMVTPSFGDLRCISAALMISETRGGR